MTTIIIVIIIHPETSIKLSRSLTGAVSLKSHCRTLILSEGTGKKHSSAVDTQTWCEPTQEQDEEYLSQAFPDVCWQPRNSRRPHWAQAVLATTSPSPAPVKPHSCRPLSLHTRRRWSILYMDTGWEALPLHQEFKSRPPELLELHLKFCPQPPKSPAMTLFPPQLLFFAPLSPRAHTMQKDPN